MSEYREVIIETYIASAEFSSQKTRKKSAISPKPVLGFRLTAVQELVS